MSDRRRPDSLPRHSGARSTRRRKQAQRRGSGPVAEPAPPPVLDPDAPVRLNRFLARAGVASRRDADALIEGGHVTVNGAVVTALGTKVAPSDTVAVDGRPVRPQGPVYVLLNKPKDTITTRSDERDRRTVMDLVDLPAGEKGALFPVGRLDRGTTGVLLLTNDGDLAHRLMHPRYGVQKLYVVTTAEPVRPHELERLREGIALDDGPAQADHAAYVGDDPREVALQIHEGRNRQVRRMFEALGHTVTALDRTRYAGLDLAGLRRGRWRRLQPHEVNALRRKVKLKPIVF
jgi:23S rRNA pseudouridine2605 synthase